MTEDRPLRVVTVAFGAANLLDQALTGVAAAFPTTVVDNSSDPLVRAVADRHAVEYVDPGSNLGFGSAANLVLRDVLTGPPTDVLLLNPDATISTADVRHLQSVLLGGGAPDVAVLSATLVGVDGVRQRELWPFPSPSRCWREAVGLGRLNRSADFVVAAVVMLRWEAIRDVGLFDERFFLYAEETDWQRRAASLGWHCDVCPTARAVHVGAATSTHSGRREALFHAGTETYVRKWFGTFGWLSYRVAAVIGAGARAAVLPGGRGRAARARAALYLRGPRRAAGLGQA